MRRTKMLFPVLAALLAAAALFPPPGAAKTYITIQDPFLRAIPLAIPVFLSGEGRAAAKAAYQATEEITEALDFTRFFNILPQKSYIADLSKGVAAKHLNFKDWTAIGAELLITGKATVQDDVLVLELRLFDTYSQKLLVGKRYKGGLGDRRRMILRFAAKVVRELTGSAGIFDTRIAFVSTATNNKEIYTCDFDGKNIQQVTKDESIALFPAWSRDGSHLAYTSYKGGAPHLYILDLSTRQGRVVAQKGLNITPAWSPTEFILAACLSRDGNPEIYSLTGDGKIIKRLTNNWGIDVSPAWFPDGKRMAYVSNRSGGPQIYLLDTETGESRRLTYEGDNNNAPAVSPRGDMIAYQSRENGLFNIWVMSADGENPVRLTQQEGSNESPCWSPDGTLIAYSSTREGESRIYVMTSRGTKKRRLLLQDGEQSEPAWSPNLPDY
ncbi:MAG: Tol-Pal system beta propeller repeat protein TolB [Deltaproteobacteria bacterium]|nr:Tol-Pal system beta propeller repeat protein TolB [Deltaproteobacteria bacterium]